MCKFVTIYSTVHVVYFLYIAIHDGYNCNGTSLRSSCLSVGLGLNLCIANRLQIGFYAFF